MDIDRLKTRLGQVVEKKTTKPHVAAGLRVLSKLVRPTYVPIIKKCELQELDRTKSFFFGLPWTSEEYPWPPIDSSIPLGPLVQLNLNDVASATGEVLGAGLLQVFLPDNDPYSMAYGQDGNGIEAFMRIIPNTAFEDLSVLTPFLWEGTTPLEICREWGYGGLPETYQRPVQEHQEKLSLPGSNADDLNYRLSLALEEEGFRSDGYKFAPADLIEGWERINPTAHTEIATMTDNELVAIFDRWGQDEFSADFGRGEDAAIISSLFTGPSFGDKFPIPALFGWPLSHNAQQIATERESMPLLIFDGIMGDDVAVFSDQALWRFGY